MNYESVITPRVTISDQPTAADLETLQAQGFAGVVNLRRDGEPDQPLSPAAEGEMLIGLGLDYLHVGVGGPPPSRSEVEAFAAFLDKHSDMKVLVHCRKGGRAAALVLAYLAKKNGWPPDLAFEKGPRLGLEVEGGMKTLVTSLLDVG